MADVPFVSLYRRFRPGRFDELKGQDHVVQALRNAVRDDRVSHAYLFSGPRGTGKTSSARILAKALNCAAPVEGEPCGVCASCTEITQGTSLDVHELDAASNNGVDAMRDLVAHAALGTPGRWKIYIVDEVHMLSNAAANALLKTLEEPPSHVVFVLATTDPQKVPDTIRSRTQHLEFRLIGADTLHELLVAIRGQAGLDVDDESVDAAVRHGDGSARDALSALDQVAASGSADSARPELTAVLAALSTSEVADVLVSLNALLAGGWGPQQLATELVDDLRQVFLAALAPELCTLSGAARTAFTNMAEAMGLARVVRSMEILGRALVDMRDAPDAQVVLEIAVVRATRPDLDAGVESLAERVSGLERAIAAGVMSGRSSVRAEADTAAAPSASSRATATPAATPTAPVASAAVEPESAPLVDVGRRPSLGAVRRRQNAAEPSAPAASTSDPTAEPAEAAPAEPVPAAAPPEVAAPSRAVDRDSLTEAWGDGLLRGLPARAKALFSAGRFVSVENGVAQFALPNAAHRDRCVDVAPLVETALQSHFGVKVPLQLVVDGGERAAPPAAAAAPTQRASAPRPVEVEDEDPEEFMADTATDTDQASAATARLLEAFPGSSEVAE